MADKPKRKRRRIRRDTDGMTAPASDGERSPFEDNLLPFEDVVPGIPDTPENVVSTFWGHMPKKDGEWEFQKKYGRKQN